LHPVQWSAWLTHTRRHPPTLEVSIFFTYFLSRLSLNQKKKQELEADLNRQRRVLSNALVIEARDQAEAEEMKRIRQHGALTAIEDAVNTRTERTRLEPKTTLEAQETPSHSVSKVLPPQFLTSRKLKSSKPFAASPQPVDSDSPVNTESENQAQASSEGRVKPSLPPHSQNPSPWKMTPTDMESWSPKTRKRG